METPRLVYVALALSAIAAIFAGITYYKVNTLVQGLGFTECCSKDGGGVGHKVGNNCEGSCYGHAMPTLQ